jgi:hypothetical protein
MNMKFQIPTKSNEYRGINVPLLNGFPCNLTLWNPFKCFGFSKEFGDGGHNKGKILYETSIKLSHTIENLDILGGFWYQHVDNGRYLLGSDHLHPLNTMYPIITPKKP